MVDNYGSAMLEAVIMRYLSYQFVYSVVYILCYTKELKKIHLYKVAFGVFITFIKCKEPFV